MFGATEDRADAMAFARRGLNDRHHFRFIVTPEDATEMTDLRAFIATSSPRRPDGERSRHQAGGWHRPWEYRHPRLHPAVRGIADDGSDLVISRDSISHGLRSRAVDLVSSELRSKPEHEICSALAREVEAERWTRLGAAIRMAADDSASSTCDRTIRASTIRRRAVTAVGRLQKLERMGLATAAGPGQ
jgi:type IV secretory pathway VirD2 relaxase